MKKNILIFLPFLIFILFSSCIPSSTEMPEGIIREADSSLINGPDSLVVDSNLLSNFELKNIYIKAISDYITAMNQKDKTKFDTLFLGDRKLGQPDDFPDIKLPEKINNVNIVMLSIIEAHGNKIKLYKKNSPMVNLMGWADKSKAEFVFVTFFPEFNHQYDCYINYTFDSTKNDYEIEELKIEVLVNDKNGKPNHFAIYKDGKHIGDKPVK